MSSSTNRDVTVVIPCFDYGEYVHEAIASALEQEGGPPQVIVVDDGSTDPGTLEALDRVPDGVTVLRQENRGPAVARNTGLAAATTPLLIALDADDRLAPGALAAMRAPLEEDARLGFAYGFVRFFGDWGGEMRMPRFDAYALLDRSLVSATALMRREVFEAVGGFDPAFRQYEDWDFWLSSVERGWRGRQVEAVTLLYRRHGETNHHTGRAAYRAHRRRLRAKHAALYARRAELARDSALGLGGRLAHRLYWGPRPMPAALEDALYRRLFRG